MEQQDQAISPAYAMAPDSALAPARIPSPAGFPTDPHDDTLSGVESTANRQPDTQRRRFKRPRHPAPHPGLSGQGATYGGDQVSRAGSNGAQAESSQSPGRNHVVIKVGMVGDAQIGKTSLMVKYVEGSWDEDYIQTLGVNFMEKTISIRNTEITFQHLGSGRPARARRFAKAMRAALIFSSTSHSINVQKIFKIVLSKAFDLKCTIPEITNVGEPLLIYQSC
ncbi:hypothetical protein CHGG_07697 [Chaetomium globosum CBS 148.51]|uniref:Septum-promoting GTP-binding protein 1 n=1 Tax=Chaetomium globosum (strain ATCC 6205 / CBS 148.51 / DSM 1962 / NBRC 6347 / NRRL 1970) TaxID=306901 RepID=Q2GWF7_CHAGB|nr:uncharacterized protein CHGG_07697 [Chaetomium globosum CBS 148.51]EAQ86444.1 hypothetical protein CHGG_07697 [Chaetomium globosum CBS 148.51]